MNEDELSGSFGSLSDTLQARLSPYFDVAVSGAWLGVLAEVGSIARDTGAWDALADDVPGVDAVVAAMDAATRAIASLKLFEATTALPALKQCATALGMLDAILHPHP